MKVLIDEELCISCGLCMQTCPEAFGAREEDDVAIVIAENPQDIPCVQEAADSCPTGAILIE